MSTAENPPHPPPDAPWFELRPSGIHGLGAFALRPIPAETTVVEYVGERIDKAESARRCEAGNPFIFTINDTGDIDGDVEWNPARFVNHSCAPNCEARQDDDDRIWLVALREIATGEELSFNYGYDITEWRDYPCACGAANCLGFIVAEQFQDQVRAELAAEKATSPAQP